jgi:hypothetical protein
MFSHWVAAIYFIVTLLVPNVTSVMELPSRARATFGRRSLRKKKR